MRTFLSIVLAVFLLALLPAHAQSKRAAGESSSIISHDAPTDISDEQAFAAYQHVTKDMKPPRARSSPDPAYPDLPPYTEPNGIVDMLIGINTKGNVELVHVLRASNPVFESSAVATVKRWRFSPAKKDGQPVPVQVTVEMKFQK